MKPLNLTLLVFCCAAATPSQGAEPIDYASQVAPVLKKYCFACHAGGSVEADLPLDKLTANLDGVKDHQKWLAVWKNLRAQTMPPADETQPTDADRDRAVAWIEQSVFKLDPQHPDPGRVTIRRLNRTEYANTIHDLLGVDYNTKDAFPADDTGYGFDVIGDVLNLSPLLMEKYVEAAGEIVAKALPQGDDFIPHLTVYGDQIRGAKNDKLRAKELSFAEPAKVGRDQYVQHRGPYRVEVEMEVGGSEEASSNTANLKLTIDGKALGEKDVGWDPGEKIVLVGQTDLAKGTHKLELELVPETPPAKGEKRLTLHVRTVRLHGPLDGSYLEYPASYKRIFFEGPPPGDAAKRNEYLKKILRRFADHAFRRPIDEPTLDRLVSLAKSAERGPKGGFEQAVAFGLTAILSSPRFLFRAEYASTAPPSDRVATNAAAVPIDEYALASRLSYFLWSTMPDDELFAAAREGRLRTELRKQVDRMLDDPRGTQLTRNFVGQWLQTRDVETLSVDARRFLKVKTSEEARKIFSSDLRRAIREETELMFTHLLQENAPLVDLLTADYTFLNDKLAQFYGIDDVSGREMRKVQLSPDDHRGGLLTQASFLLVTSNPTRTSPVKRGLFILENLLGTPAPPPPADVPPLEAVKDAKKKLSMREMMEIHRREPLCASCHARMDPLGLALEEYNTIGMWRDEENGKPIETRGQLITGEKFGDVAELSRVIAQMRRKDFYRCVTEKLLTYALGRGVEYYDAPAVDRIVAALGDDGRMRTLIYGIVESAPFQLRRSEPK